MHSPPLSLRLPANARSTVDGRHFVIDTLESWGLVGLIDVAALLTSEVVTNAVLHARTEFTVTITHTAPEVAEVSVRDGSTTAPQRRHATAEATNGRGVALLDQLAASWSVETTSTGKTVTFSVEETDDLWAGADVTNWMTAEL